MDFVLKSLSSRLSIENISKIGQGSFGEVFLIEEETKQFKVVKQVRIKNLPPGDKASAVDEALILSKLNHPNVLILFDFFSDDDFFYMVMEYANSGDLRKLILDRKLKKKLILEQDALYILYQCFLGLAHIHSKNVIHRDIKSDNIFLHNNGTIVKLGDFGIAKVLHKSSSFAQTMVGTPYYFSPELCEDKPYDMKTDIWSLGCVAYELLQLDLPFKANSLPRLLHIITSNHPRPLQKTYSRSLRMLVKSMLSKTPTERPSVHEILTNGDIDWPLKDIDQNNISLRMIQDKSRIRLEYDQEKATHDKFQNENITFHNISWKSAMKEAELNIFNVEDKKNFDLVNKNDNVKTVGFGAAPGSKENRKKNKSIHFKCHGEGINTLVGRLEHMEKKFSELHQGIKKI